MKGPPRRRHFGICLLGLTMKRTAFIAAAALTLLAPASLSFAQNQLPTTTVAAPKQKPRTTPASRPTPPAQTSANSNSALPAHPDPAYPNIHVKDWNAPGMLNLHYMNDAQFAAFQAMHPTTVFYGRCYSGQDPDDNIRGWLRRHRPITCDQP
jgi:hypothetical protein